MVLSKATILIDVRARCDCLTIAFLVVRPHGLVVLHDAERQNYHSGISLFPSVKFVRGREIAVMAKSRESLSILDLLGTETETEQSENIRNQLDEYSEV